MTRGAFVTLAVLVGAGCGGTLPDPIVRSVTPAQLDQGQIPLLEVEAEAVLPFHADLGRSALTVDDTVRLRVAGAEAPSPIPVGPGRWQVSAPFGLPPGIHAVELELADGRKGTLADALEVSAVLLPDGLTIDPVGTQRRGVPFTLTVRATGPGGPGYQGTVRLSTNRGTITPAVSGPFSDGVLNQAVSLNQVGNDVVISAEDPAGHMASSNPFQVTP